VIITLRCTPPSVTAQVKRLRVVNGKPMFFHGARMKREEATWATLLAPYVPAEPFDGPLTLSIRLVYPHGTSARKADRDRLVPKATRPDASNAIKHLEDCLTRMRFVVDDARFARVSVEKLHGPEAEVGIRIEITPFTEAA
jgi:Holliday junction resolvase RusA-like endonuclease